MMSLYVMFDKVAKKASAPFDATNDEAAYRGFRIRLEGVPELARGDFKLLHVADFDDSTGFVTGKVAYEVDSPKALDNALEVGNA